MHALQKLQVLKVAIFTGTRYNALREQCSAMLALALALALALVGHQCIAAVGNSQDEH